MSHGIHLLVSAGADAGADFITAALTNAGHHVIGRQAVGGGIAAIQQALRGAGADSKCQAVFVLGACGLGAGQGAPEAIRSLTTTDIPGFAQVARLTIYRERGSQAVQHRPAAAVIGTAVAITLPTDSGLLTTLTEELVLPELDSLVAAITGEPLPAAPDPADEVEDAIVEEIDEAEPTLPPPEVRWSLAGGGGISIEASESETAGDDEDAEVPAQGWKRAVYDMEGELLRGKTPDIPDSIESLAPIMNVLHQAGEYSMMKLPNGNKVMLYGFPDLQRTSSKVLMVGWGEPFAEVVALHRYPRQAGLSIDETRGMMPRRNSDIAAVAEAVTGRAPDDTSGELYAVDHDAIFIERNRKVYRWDGKRERQEGNAKQALATLVISWHQR